MCLCGCVSRGEVIIEQETLCVIFTSYAHKVFNCYEACLKTILQTRDLIDIPGIFSDIYIFS
jgi:hypothetical protein